MNPCKVCILDRKHREVIDEALRNAVPLDEIARGCGIGRSSLHRHFHRHMSPDRSAAHPSDVAPVRATERMPAAVAASEPPVAETRKARPTKQQLINRIEMLWGEGLDGLAVSKQPISVIRADGSQFQIPGDLKARKGFLGELRELVRLQGEATGELVRGSVEANFAIQIVMPTMTSVPSESGPHDPPIIDIAVVKRS